MGTTQILGLLCYGEVYYFALDKDLLNQPSCYNLNYSELKTQLIQRRKNSQKKNYEFVLIQTENLFQQEHMFAKLVCLIKTTSQI